VADTPISFAQKVCETERLGCANILLLLQMLWQVCAAQKPYLTQAVCEIIVLLVFQSTHQGRLWFQLVYLAFSRRFLAFQNLILSHLWAFLCLAICFHRTVLFNTQNVITFLKCLSLTSCHFADCNTFFLHIVFALASYRVCFTVFFFNDFCCFGISYHTTAPNPFSMSGIGRR